MRDYLDAESDYSEKDIQICSSILYAYSDSLLAVNGNRQGILSVVEKTVKQLNKLNNNCDGSLIETDQREQIYSIIESLAREFGLIIEDNEDITEKWREW